jgi:hypothetical protein|tara:strand:- start:10579 stop:11154 length:576 start_codon:yes stop_codon:yes gene_type:complete
MIEQKFYLNFREDTGSIWKVTNELDVSSPYMEIDKDTMLDFAEERKNLADYIAIPSDSGKSKFELKIKHKTLESFDVDKSIHQLPKNLENESLIFYIIQDIKNATWRAKLSPNLKDLLNSTAYYKDKNHIIFVTQQDDPNILLDTLTVKFSEALSNTECVIQNTNKEVAQRTDVSVYCGKVFENYSHIMEE